MTAGDPVILRLRRDEAQTLADLAAQLVTLIEDAGDADDPAVSRLTPTPYPDDEDAATEFRRATRDDLLTRRAQDARVVIDALAGGMNAASPRAITRVEVDADAFGAWMRTLTALRLVIATRLGIQNEDDGDRTDPLFTLYDWLGLRLEMLLAADV